MVFLVRQWAAKVSAEQERLSGRRIQRRAAFWIVMLLGWNSVSEPMREVLVFDTTSARCNV
jgi:hypothetical protein